MGSIEIGTRIRELREQQGLATAQLAERLGVGEAHVSRLERGEEALPSKMLLRIAEALDVKPVRFFEDRPGADQPTDETMCPKCGHRFRAMMRE